MEKKTLKLIQFFALDAELNGVRNQQNGEVLVKGILNEKLPMYVKYWLTNLAKVVGEEKKACEELRNEMIKKYGEEKDGGVSIPLTIKDEEGNEVQNPQIIEFEKEYNELLNQEKEIEYKQLSIDDFSKLETEENYSILFSLLKP